MRRVEKYGKSKSQTKNCPCFLWIKGISNIFPANILYTMSESWAYWLHWRIGKTNTNLQTCFDFVFWFSIIFDLALFHLAFLPNILFPILNCIDNLIFIYISRAKKLNCSSQANKKRRIINGIIALGTIDSLECFSLAQTHTLDCCVRFSSELKMHDHKNEVYAIRIHWAWFARLCLFAYLSVCLLCCESCICFFIYLLFFLKLN